TICYRDWSSDVCSSDLGQYLPDAPLCQQVGRRHPEYLVFLDLPEQVGNRGTTVQVTERPKSHGTNDILRIAKSPGDLGDRLPGAETSERHQRICPDHVLRIVEECQQVGRRLRRLEVAQMVDGFPVI